ncbi:MAG: SMC-Scp complex subunit ScpB [Candidatus Thermoplasmatota archaeon]|nr:SMC-Scp complex subunit ScpB [Candidatus Thermoplasmatota archaeon]MEC8789485.1 SMC-Scp complex subunit ScpB [Candidatus Thermoplasmatota archaeon]|tara:strand:+ start:48 stop:656 length:609 start_codon:yes stop_codon:yes gene_type:complete
MSEIPLETLLEATLFSAGRSLSVQELSENLGYEDDEILESMNNLQSTIKRRRGGGLQIVEIGGKWAMEVKPGIADHLPKETKSELPPKLLKAAALIAYHQPMPQSRLVELLGQRAYDHIRELAQAGLIGRRRDGNTRRLTTTRRFSEMFGCPHTDRKKVRAWFREMVTSSGMLDGMEGKLALRDETDTEGGVQTTLDIAEDE